MSAVGSKCRLSGQRKRRRKRCAGQVLMPNVDARFIGGGKMTEPEEDWTGPDRELAAFKESINASVIRDLNAVDGHVPYQPTIYHYTDAKGALAILQSGRLWFTERVYLNDPTEILYGLKVAHERFEVGVRAKGATIPRDFVSHLTGEHDLGLSIFGFWVASFSLDGDNLGQWRSYADDGRGVCLGFSTDQLDMIEVAKQLPNNPNSLRFPVNYDRAKLEQKMQEYVDVGLEFLAKCYLPRYESYYKKFGAALLYEREFMRIMNAALYSNSVLFKHPAYKHEQEYRALISGTRSMISNCEYYRLRERNGEIVGYLDLPIPGWKSLGRLATSDLVQPHQMGWRINS
jgi:hypothetical protein